MTDMTKDNLCITCAKCKSINSDGYAGWYKLPEWGKYQDMGY